MLQRLICFSFVFDPDKRGGASHHTQFVFVQNEMMILKSQSKSLVLGLSLRHKLRRTFQCVSPLYYKRRAAAGVNVFCSFFEKNAS